MQVIANQFIWRQILWQTLLTWGILLGLDLLSYVLFRAGVLYGNVLSDVTSFIFLTGLIAMVQGCLIGFKKGYSVWILPVVFVLIQMVDIITLLFSTDPVLVDWSDELLALKGFLLCPYMSFHYDFQSENLLSLRNFLWCFKWSFSIGLYYWLVFFSVRRIIQ